MSEYTGQIFHVPNRLLVVFSDNGGCRISLDGQIAAIQPANMLVLHPGQQVALIEVDENVSLSIIGFTVAMQDVMLKQFSLNFFSYIRNKSIWKLKPRTCQVLRSFYDIYDFNFNRTPEAVYTEIANSMFSNFLQMFYQLVREEVDEHSAASRPLNTRTLAGKFFILLNDEYKKHHNVSWYSSKLCISSKYLTQIVKQISPQTPKEIIDKRLGLEALFLLTKTTMNIQQISNDLGFPDQSYFGRFFKRIFGMSPLNYRVNPDLSIMDKLKVGMSKLEERGNME